MLSEPGIENETFPFLQGHSVTNPWNGYIPHKAFDFYPDQHVAGSKDEREYHEINHENKFNHNYSSTITINRKSERKGCIT